ncbi:MAG: ribonucleoside triphosphate reductase [Elusimicrobia bacterium]|nr:ribonucleoside triphosphate reductase [Elusimicrobiota bacterium]
MARKFLQSIIKRNGEKTEFNVSKIKDAIDKAMRDIGLDDQKLAQKTTEETVHYLKKKFGYKDPTVEEVQDAVEKKLIEAGHAQIAKAFIIYRHSRNENREKDAFLNKIRGLVDSYTSKDDWRVAENSNVSYSISAMQEYISGAVIAEYALKNSYPNEIAEAHRSGDFHIHDLSVGSFAGYCAGWSLSQLLYEGFNGVRGRIAAKPAKHFNAALGQIVNFLGTLQNEWAGAQAFSSFDTYLAPLVAKDNLTYGQVKQSLQEFVFAINATSRWGNQVPFTNITMDLTPPEDIKDKPIIYGGEFIQGEKYQDFQAQMDMINKAFIEVMLEGDMNGRIFTFPIPTYNITRDFDWDSEISALLFEMTAKYGIPYFQNFVNSDLNPGDVRSMCCRLQLDVRHLKKKTGALFGSGEKTGSIGVVTINLPRIGYLSETKEEFFNRLDDLMYLAKESLEIKRKDVNKNLQEGLLPWSQKYLGNLNNHFSTIGLVGMNEACLNFLGQDITTAEGKAFALEVMDFMRDRLTQYQEQTSNIYNLEATPAEGTAYRLARLDKKKYPEILTAGKNVPYYTNSTQLPVKCTDDIFFALEHQQELQSKYTGGTVLHMFTGESNITPESCKNLIKKVAYKSKMPYFTFTPTFSICPEHGFIAGEHFKCPTCETATEVYSRVVGYFRPVSNWNEGKREEYGERKTFKLVGAVEEIAAREEEAKTEQEKQEKAVVFAEFKREKEKAERIKKSINREKIKQYQDKEKSEQLALF